MTGRFHRLLWLGLIAGAGALLAPAHDGFEITTFARIRANRLEVDVTMTRSTALALARGIAEAPTFEAADFPRHRAAMVAAAPRLFAITAGGRPLGITAASVSLGQEGEVDFHLVYPPPRGGALRIEATHLAGLPEGYGNVLVVRDDAGPMGNALLRLPATTLQVALPEPRPPAITTVANRALWGTALLAGIIAGGWWLQRTRFA